ncbi:MAG TPA: carbohydrate kinase family protein [Pyrinomonadaceae bacterium]
MGELNVDLIAVGLANLPALGSEVLAKDFEITLGSASAIFAGGLSQLGFPVTFISKVGADYFGQFCVQALRAKGVCTDNVICDSGVKTGVTIAVSTAGDRALVTYPGAIAQLRYEELPRSFLENHQHLHMTSYYLQEGLRKSFARIFIEAKQSGLTTSFDPNADPARTWGKGIRGVFPHTDVLFLNETEAMQLTRQSNVDQALQRLGQTAPCVVVKLGPRGAVAIQNEEVSSVPGFEVEAVDTTGAGDCFAAGFISGYVEGLTVRECLELGNACGALSTLRPGGTAGQPDHAAIKKLLESRAVQK